MTADPYGKPYHPLLLSQNCHTCPHWCPKFIIQPIHNMARLPLTFAPRDSCSSGQPVRSNEWCVSAQEFLSISMAVWWHHEKHVFWIQINSAVKHSEVWSSESAKSKSFTKWISILVEDHCFHHRTLHRSITGGVNIFLVNFIKTSSDSKSIKSWRNILGKIDCLRAWKLSISSKL